MALRFKVRYFYTDYNGETSETSYNLTDVSSVQALDTFVLAQEAVMQGLSDAPITAASAFARLTPTLEKPITGPASIYKRLLVLYRADPRYGSFIIPAPRADLDYLTDGPFAGIKVAPGPNPTANLLDQLMAALAPTLLPDGTPFPVGEWQAALMSNPE